MKPKMELVEAKFPRRHGAAVELLLGSVVVRIEYDTAGKIRLAYADEDENQIQKVWRSDKLKHTDAREMLGNVGELLKEVAEAISDNPKKLVTEIPRRMKLLLGHEAKEDESKRE